ncbi:MAG: aldehyde ferredoxin oxidoreductase family protein [Anaerolineales bacterium]|nr:aldehyde ferredoxin oxidoreductase family protein [Anaerolineales bacterium]
MQPILTVDLTTSETGQYIVPDGWERSFLGGASLAARLLYESITPDLDPFSPEAPLLFLNGPLSGTAGPAVGRFVVCGKSPATGLWAESNCGGFWGPELRFAGYDGLWITGASQKSVYLWINDRQVDFRRAGRLQGMDTYRTQEAVRQEVDAPRARVAVIGPAGEKRVSFAGIFCDHGRTAGRTGLGAVMGSKNLKAVAVRGTNKIPLSDRETFAALRRTANRELLSDTVAGVARALGTAGVAEYADYMGGMPKKYYSQGSFEGVSNVSGAAMSETILTGVKACHGCVIACGRVVELEDGQPRKGPEYETIVGFGPNLLIDDLAEVTLLGEMCDRYGLDAISSSNIIGLAYKLFEDGILTEKDTDGVKLSWGQPQPARRLLEMMAAREGLGDLMAEGSLRFAQHFGVGEEAVQVNGLETAYHDPRGTSGMALSYATSPRGACHNKSDYFLVDWGQADADLGMEFYDKHAGIEKVGNIVRHQNFRSLCDALVLCLFSNVSFDVLVNMINAAMGLQNSLEDYLRVGERAWNLKRAINNRLGLSRENDRLPKAFLKPFQDGNAAGYVPPFQEMLSVYYEARAWDPVTGRPTRKKLIELGLEEIADDLWGVEENSI